MHEPSVGQSLPVRLECMFAWELTPRVELEDRCHVRGNMGRCVNGTSDTLCPSLLTGRMNLSQRQGLQDAHPLHPALRRGPCVSVSSYRSVAL